MYKKNRLKAVLAFAVIMAFIMPVTAFASNEKDVNKSLQYHLAKCGVSG